MSRRAANPMHVVANSGVKAECGVASVRRRKHAMTGRTASELSRALAELQADENPCDACIGVIDAALRNQASA